MTDKDLSTVPNIELTKLVNESLFSPSAELVLGAIVAYRPTTIDLTQIDGWFGSKWLGFTGKSLGAVPWHDRGELAVPAFHPNRVVNTITVRRLEGSEKWAVVENASILHRAIPSARNITRRLRKFRPRCTLLIWHGTTVDARSSLMAYLLGQDGDLSWHVEWDLSASPIRAHGTGITDQELAMLRSQGSTSGVPQ